MNRAVDSFTGSRDRLKPATRASALAAAAILLSSCAIPNAENNTNSAAPYTDAVTQPVAEAATDAQPPAGIEITTPAATLNTEPNELPKHKAKKAVKKPGPVIAIDAGHGPTHTDRDAATGLVQQEGLNEPETDDVWAVAQQVKKQLLADGYRVVMLKRAKKEIVTFRERASRADDAHAAIAVSIHGDSTLPHTGEIFPQEVGLYRGTGNHKTVYQDAATAKLSMAFSKVIQTSRKKTEGPDIIIKANSFNGRPGLEPGNIPMVQLFSHTPWIYSEKRMPFNVLRYSTSLVNGIEAAVPVNN